MKNTLVIGIVALIAGLVLGSTAMPGFTSRMGGSGMRSQIDKHFIEEMIPHHEGAIAMAELALERSKNPDILTLSNAIIEAQTKEINNMRTWYKEWFGTDVPVTSSMRGMGRGAMGHMQGMEGDLAAISVAPDFDKEFLSQMIVHHEMAIMMGRMLASGTERSEMKTLADQIIASQTREIDMMRGWLE